jgi:hypothetical protein
MRALVFTLLLLLPFPVATAQQLPGYTQMINDGRHGTQIEYLTEGGKAFLWYPGNSNVLEGRWKREGQDICFAYGENTFNPVTGHQGGGWECMSFDMYWRVVEERMPGDLFALQGRGAVPFRLDPKRTTLEKLLARVSPGAEAPPVELSITEANGDRFSMSGESLVANAERSKTAMSHAVPVYFYGRFMGKPCVEIDYDRAYDLAQRAGISFEPWARVLRERAASGHPNAVSAVERLGL